MQMRVLNKAFLILCLFNAFLWLNPFEISNVYKETRQASEQLVCANHVYAISNEPTKSFLFVGLNLGLSTISSSPNTFSKKISKFFIKDSNSPNFQPLLTYTQKQKPSLVQRHLSACLSLRGPPRFI